MTFMKRLFASKPVPAGLKEMIIKDTASHDVVIYSKGYCPYCSRTKELFQSEFSQVTPKIFELDQMDDGSSIQDALAQITKQRTVPNVWIKGKFVGGNDDTMALFRSGKLKEMLSEN